jgi:hypothetical protein
MKRFKDMSAEEKREYWNKKQRMRNEENRKLKKEKQAMDAKVNDARFEEFLKEREKKELTNFERLKRQFERFGEVVGGEKRLKAYAKKVVEIGDSKLQGVSVGFTR